jgi:hypothetical protein
MAFLNTNNNNINKKFWEYIIAYLPCYNMNRIENDASKNSSVVACEFAAHDNVLLSCCRATMRIHRHAD